MMKRLIFIAVLLIVLTGCKREPTNNFPPRDTDVELVSTNLPIVWIEVKGRTIDRYQRVEGHMKIIDNGKGNLNYADLEAHPGQRIDYEGYISLRYRGNSTFNDSPKKPLSFRTLDGPIKYASKQRVKILGMGKDDNWALLAPYSDKSMMRDLLAFEISRPWMEYTPQGRYCEVFLDGTYYGVYILCEVVSEGKHRLNLAKPRKEGIELTGDYLVEVDYDDDVHYRSKYHPVDSNGKALTDRFIHFQYKSPKYEDLNSAQLHYINRRIDAMEQALASPQFSDPKQGYRRYIDVMSFIDYQIAMELGHSIDGYRKSGKLYKRRDNVDGRFKTVVWDMNLAYGNCKIREGWRTEGWIYQSNDLFYAEGEDFLIPFWWTRLNSDEAYTAMLRDRWAQYRQSNLREEALMAVIDSMATVLTAQGAMQRDSQAWPRWGKYVWPNYYISKDFDDEIAFLKQWLRDRIAWMDSQLGFNLEINEQPADSGAH
jgi:spore coat protein CotH